MNIEKKLEKLGIITVREFTQREVRYIAEEVTELLVKAFPVLEDSYNNLLIRLLNCKMYFANINKGKSLSDVNYIYENNSIYFDEKIDLNNISDKVIHECIHYLQDVRNEKGKLKKMGLCGFEELSTYGLGINEGAVQYIAAKAVGNTSTITKKSGIILKTISPDYYPFLTNLIQQIVYVVGENIIVNGTINCDEKFEEDFLNTFEEHSNTIIKMFDKIIDLRNKCNEEKQEENKKIFNKQIADEYIETQNTIMRTYFDKICNRLTTIEEVDFYIEKFLNYKPLLGIVEETRFSLNDEYEQYKEQILKKFDKRIMEISKESSKNTLSVIYNNRLFRFFKKIFSYFTS